MPRFVHSTEDRREPPAVDRSVSVSVVVPFYNEEEGAAAFVEELRSAITTLPQSVEVILIDDGSSDQTGAILDVASKHWAASRVIHLGVNRGQGAALYHGLRSAHGEILVTMDGDGQNVPADLPHLLRRIQSGGADMVAGVRRDRHDPFLRRKMSRLANRIRRCVLADGVSDTGCGLKAFRREVVESFVPIRTLYSFMPALAIADGFRVVEQPVAHRPRLKGKSKYGLQVMLWRPLLDMAGIWWFTHRRFPTRETSLETRR
jgi:glycosyltransferase involved in cell wall biosynthesis